MYVQNTATKLSIAYFQTLHVSTESKLSPSQAPHFSDTARRNMELLQVSCSGLGLSWLTNALLLICSRNLLQ